MRIPFLLGVCSLPLFLYAQQFSLSWSFHDLGASVAAAGLIVTDLDGDGQEEILHASGKQVYISRTETGADLSSDILAFDGTIQDIRVAPTHQDGSQDLFVLDDQGTLRVLNGKTLTLVQRFDTPITQARALAVADIGKDEVWDIWIGGGEKLGVYGYNNGFIFEERIIDAPPVYDMEVGDVDGDGSEELILSTSQEDQFSFVINTSTYAAEWFAEEALGETALGDIDGNGVREIISLQAGELLVMDGLLQGERWRIDTGLDVALAVAAIDLDGDNKVEILVGSEAKLTAYRGDNGQVLWETDALGGGITHVAAGDPDGDQALDLVWGTGTLPLGEAALNLADAATRTTTFHSEDFLALDVFSGDLGDGQGPQVWVGTQSFGNANSRIRIFDALSFQEKHNDGFPAQGLVRNLQVGATRLPNKQEWLAHDDRTLHVLDASLKLPIWRSPDLGADILGLTLADTDADPELEIYVWLEGGTLQVYDYQGTQYQVQRTATLPVSLSTRSEVQCFLNENGQWQVLTLHQGRIRSYSLSDLALSWESPANLPLFNHMVMGDLDLNPNGRAEVAAIRTQGDLVVLNAETGALKARAQFSPSLASPGSALALGNVDANAFPEILIANGPQILVLDANGLILRTQIDVPDTDISRIQVNDIDGDRLPEVWIAAINGVYQLEGDEAIPVSSSDRISSKRIGLEVRQDAGNRQVILRVQAAPSFLSPIAVSVVDLVGRTCFEGSFVSENQPITLSTDSWSSGLYLIRVESGEGVASVKVVVP